MYSVLSVSAVQQSESVIHIPIFILPVWILRSRVPGSLPRMCLTLSYPIDCSLPGSSVQGIFQARVLEWSGEKAHTHK